MEVQSFIIWRSESLKKPSEQSRALDLQLAPAPPVNKIQSTALKDAWFNITDLAFFMFLVLMTVSSATTTSTLVADATLYLLPPFIIRSEMYQINFFTT